MFLLIMFVINTCLYYNKVYSERIIFFNTTSFIIIIIHYKEENSILSYFHLISSVYKRGVEMHQRHTRIKIA